MSFHLCIHPISNICEVRGVGFDTGKKEAGLEESVRSKDKNTVISLEHLTPPHTNTTTHPGNTLGSQSNTVCLIPLYLEIRT